MIYYEKLKNLQDNIKYFFNLIHDNRHKIHRNNITSVVQAVNSGAYYRIRSEVTDKLLSVENTSLSNRANVQQHSWLSGENPDGYRKAFSQIWQIIDVGEGYYAIVNHYSGKVLEVEKEGLYEGINVRQNTWTGANKQHWYVSPLRLNSQHIRTKLYMRYMTPLIRSFGDPWSEVLIRDGANVVTYGFDGSWKNQQWNVTKVRRPTVTPDSHYRIRSVESGKVLTVDNSGNVKQSDWKQGLSNTLNQQWLLRSGTAGYYILVPMSDKNNHLAVSNSSKNNRANIISELGTSSVSNVPDHHQWKLMTGRVFSSINTRSYRIVAKHSNKPINIYSSHTGGSNNIVQWDFDDSESQSWFFEKLEEERAITTEVSENHILWPLSAYSDGENKPNVSNRLREGDTVSFITPLPIARHRSTYYVPTRDTEFIMDAEIIPSSTGSSSSIEWSIFRRGNLKHFIGTVTEVDSSNPDYSFKIKYTALNGKSFGHPLITKNIALLPQPEVYIPDVTIFKGDDLNITPSIENKYDGFQVDNWLSHDASIVTISHSGKNAGQLTAHQVGYTTVTALFNDGETQSSFNVRVVDVDPLESFNINNLMYRPSNQPFVITNGSLIHESFEYNIENPKPELINVRTGRATTTSFIRDSEGNIIGYNSSRRSILYDIKPDGFTPDTSEPFDVKLHVKYINENGLVSEKTVSQTINPMYIVIDVN